MNKYNVKMNKVQSNKLFVDWQKSTRSNLTKTDVDYLNNFK